MTHCFVKGYTRKYYKTVTVSAKYEYYYFSSFSESAAMGGDECALSVSSGSKSPLFTSTRDDYWEHGLNSWIQLYFPNGANISSLRTSSAGSSPTFYDIRTIELQASNDGSNWITVDQDSDSASSYTMFFKFSYSGEYKYYRCKVIELGTGSVARTEAIDISAKHKLNDSYTYETDGTADDYDRYEDFPNLLIPVINNQKYGVEIK